MSTEVELVVACHEEDLAWLRRVPKSMRVTVYNKGGSAGRGLSLPNHGREAHTYLHHLVERYESLASLTVFVQGHPFDHAHDLHRWLRDVAGGLEVADFWWLGFLADTDDACGRRLFVPWSKNVERRELDLSAFHRRLFGRPGADEYRFFVGAQFAVTRDAVHRHPRAFYEEARDLSLHFPDAAHCFERCWDRVFGVDGTGGRLAPGQTTAWFKPIRRLAQPAQNPSNPPLVEERKPR